MGEQQFQINRYACRVAIVSDVDRTEDHRYVEIYGIWADTRSAFRNQFVPLEMWLERGDPVYVIEQVAGRGKQANAWVAFTSDEAPRYYTVPNLDPRRLFRIRDRIAAVPDRILEVAAIAAMALLGWQYSWWAALLTGSATAARAWYGKARHYAAERRIDIARVDEAKLFAEAADRLYGLQQAWRRTNGIPREDDARTKPQDDPAPDDVGQGNWHEKLKLAPTASLIDAEQAYRRALKECHPDLHMHLSQRMRELAQEESRALNAAIEQARAHFAATSRSA